MPTSIRTADVVRRSFIMPSSMIGKSVAAQNDLHARQVADAIVRSDINPLFSKASSAAPRLDVPEQPLPEQSQLFALLDSLQPVEDGGKSVAVQDAIRQLHVNALQSMPPQQRAQLASGDTTPLGDLLASAQLDGVRDQVQVLVGLLDGNSPQVLPTSADLAVLGGTVPPATEDAAALIALLDSAPSVRDVAEEASRLDEKEFSVRMATDPRFAVVLLLVGYLMQLAATQREQAMAMLGFAEQAIKEMGINMVESAKQARLAKVVALVVVVVVSAAAVAVGTAAASRNIGSIRNHQVKANALNKDAAATEVDIAMGVNGRGSAQAQTAEGRETLRQTLVEKRGHAAEEFAKHGVRGTQSAVITQTGQVLGQAANAGGSAAGSGHEITAAELTARQEKRRTDSNTGQQSSQGIGQNAGKIDETQANLFRQMQQAEQDKADTNNEIARKL